MKLLHTADWHLGAMLYQHGRYEEQQAFLAWLLMLLQKEDIQALLIAGDVFHHSSPSAEALALYYRFLADVAATTPVRHVIIIGGNHDSASKLEAPQAILRPLSVHVIGGYSPKKPPKEYLVPLMNEEGEVVAMVVALPFIHPHHLKVRLTDHSPEGGFEALSSAFRILYSTFADAAKVMAPASALIGMGHLTCYDEDQSPSFATCSHDALPSSIFDERYDYVALGHIHAAGRVGKRPVYYSGSPMAYSFGHSSSPHSVFVVACSCVPHNIVSVAVEALDVPCWRQLVALRGEVLSIEQQLKALSFDEPLTPYLFIDLHVERYHPHLGQTLHAMLDALPLRPRLIHIRQTLNTSLQAPASRQEAVLSLYDLEPDEVFRRSYRAKYHTDPPQEIEEAFRAAWSSLDQELAAL